MYDLEITIYDTTTEKEWTEYFDSWYLFRKRRNKLLHSKKLKITSMTYKGLY